MFQFYVRRPDMSLSRTCCARTPSASPHVMVLDLGNGNSLQRIGVGEWPSLDLYALDLFEAGLHFLFCFIPWKGAQGQHSSQIQSP